MLLVFDESIINITTELQVVDLGGEPEGVEVWSASSAKEFVYQLGTGKCIQEKERNAKEEFMGSGFERDDPSALFSKLLPSSEFQSHFCTENCDLQKSSGFKSG